VISILRRREAISCRELVELVTDFFEGALSRADRARFEAHVGDCDHCAAYLDQMRLTVTAVGSLSEESLDPDAREALLEAFRGWKIGRG
jgi:anti-sigma factor RsiW